MGYPLLLKYTDTPHGHKGNYEEDLLAALSDTKINSYTYLSDEQLVALQARLSRIKGQVGGIHRMLSDHRDCDDILTQVASINAAMQQVALLLLQSHLEACVADAITSGERESAVGNFKTSLSRVIR